MMLSDYSRDEIQAALDRLAQRGVFKTAAEFARGNELENEILRERKIVAYHKLEYVVTASVPGILGRTYEMHTEPMTREGAIEVLSEIRQNKHGPSTGLARLDHATGQLDHVTYAEFADELQVQVAKWFGGKGKERSY